MRGRRTAAASILGLGLGLAPAASPQDYEIYGVAQDLPMGFPDEKRRKNFYVTIGGTQGLREGTRLDVIREVERLHPDDSGRTYRHSVRIGGLRVVHAGESSSIAVREDGGEGRGDLVLDVPGPMVGDRVGVVTD